MTIQTVAGRYSLTREVGRGGAGAVWLGRDEVLGRDVAVKRIGLPPGAEDADIMRAEREARLAARVIHPNVVSVFDFVEDREQHWLVMEYVAGTDLARLVKTRGPLPPAEAARMIGDAAQALAAAHELGIVHRDVKPSNILVGADGTVKLSDFGIARGTADPSLTQTGLVTGSPAFLAPEVATGGSATAASDVWALGATLFHTLAGRPPYDAGNGDQHNALATLFRIAHEEPPRLETEPWLESLLEATMTRGPRPTAAEVATYLASEGADVEATQVLPEAREAAPAPIVTTAWPSVPADDPATASAVPHHPGRRKADRGHRAVVVGGSAIAVLAVIGALLLWVGFADGDEQPAADPPSSATAGSDNESESPTESSAGPAATEAELEDFARTYVETASADPDRGFAMLTPAYQAQSPRYRQFWGSIKKPTILRIAADVPNLRVAYTYSYIIKSAGKRTEDVQLQLVRDGDDLLIAGDF